MLNYCEIWTPWLISYVKWERLRWGLFFKTSDVSVDGRLETCSIVQQQQQQQQ
jgi:hypothetical protein